MVSREGAQKLLRLCPKAIFHIDIDVSPFLRHIRTHYSLTFLHSLTCYLWHSQAFRFNSLRMYVSKPLMAYQTFDSTSLTDLHRRGLLGLIKRSRAFIKLNEVASDKYTRQTVRPSLSADPSESSYGS